MMPGRGAGRPRALVAKATKAERARERQKAGTLQELRVSARTAKRYTRALETFFRWAHSDGRHLPHNVDDLDSFVSMYVETCWHEGEGRSKASDTLSALGWKSPKVRAHLAGAWHLIGAWQRYELPTRAPPLPRDVFFAMAEHFTRLALPGVALAVLVGGHCVLRTTELATLTFSQIEFAGDYTSAVVSLGVTKGGARRGASESVTIELPWLAAAVKAASLNADPGDTLIGVSTSRFRTLFAQALDALNCAGWGFMPYSIRRGGATELWRVSGNLSKVTLRGRWGHASTTRVYVNDGLARLAEFKLPASPMKDLALAFSRRMQAPVALFERPL